MKQRVLAIGIPSYNGEMYLDRCIPTFIDSRIRDKIEVFIVNDGSKDSTQEIAEKFQRMYPDTVKVINKENGGHGSAVNAALYACNSKYYKVVDCDDWVDTDNLVKLVEFLENCDVDIVTNAYNQVNMISGESIFINNYNVLYEKVYTLDELDMENLYFSIHSTTYKTDILTKNNIKLQEKTFYVDVEYQLLPFEFVNTVVFLDYPVYKYMVGNVNQSVNVKNFVKRYDDHNRVVHRVLDYLKTASLSVKQEDYVYNILEKVIYTHYALSSIYDDDFERGQKRSLEFDDYLKSVNDRLYKFIGKKYSDIRKLRKSNFVRKSSKKSLKKIVRLIVRGY